MSLKSDLKALLVEDELDDVFTSLLSSLPEDSGQHAEAIILSSRWAELKTDERTEQAADKEIRQQKNNLVGDLLALINDLPDDISPDKEENEDLPGLAPKGIAETRFKWIVFIGIVLTKGILLIYIDEIGAFTSEQSSSLFGILLPVFTASFLLMAKHLWDRTNQAEKAPEKKINLKNQLLVYFTLIAYFLSMWLAIRHFATQEADMVKLLGKVNTTEGIFGAVLAYFVTTLFQEEK